MDGPSFSAGLQVRLNNTPLQKDQTSRVTGDLSFVLRLCLTDHTLPQDAELSISGKYCRHPKCVFAKCAYFE